MGIVIFGFAWENCHETRFVDCCGERMILKGKKLSWGMKVGLEIHAQLQVSSKLFSESPTKLSSTPNAAVSFFDAAYPGTLPTLNKGFVSQAVRAALALNCKFNNLSKFERKHYFYQDLPHGYQITQRLFPFAHSGLLKFSYYSDGDSASTTDKISSFGQVSIDRIQIEIDSGKSIHDQHPSHTLVDLNRAGVGLIEIVFNPDLCSPEQAAATLRTTREILRHIGVCDGNLETGSMRCDVNVSVHPHASVPLDIALGRNNRSRVEIKNLSSIQRVRDAVVFEAARQIACLEAGEALGNETRAFDPDSGKTYKIRDKEDSVDYRFMPGDHAHAQAIQLCLFFRPLPVQAATIGFPPYLLRYFGRSGFARFDDL